MVREVDSVLSADPEAPSHAYVGILSGGA